MKFKAQDKQNQLIENVTSIHLVVGVDIAQETHDAKNVQAFFKTTPRVPHVITRYDATVRTEINNGRKEIATGDKDVNTVIREIQEKADQKLAEMK